MQHLQPCCESLYYEIRNFGRRPMENTDVELIQRTLTGNQEAFTALVQKYQKRVHALAWRKTEDFHVAEEIMQDTFLRAYRRLGTLKNPNLFAGWLYVIANRLCHTWLKKKRPDMQSLETVPTFQLEENSYTKYTEKEREADASDQRVELVNRLLQKLPESERTVITLYYLADSSYQEISEFLGVSLNTVKSRLHRARERLQKEEYMVRETLGSFQPSTTLTEDIIRTLRESGMQIDPAASSASKPFVPWIFVTSAIILVSLMFGLGSQNLARFQHPYSLDTTSEMTVEIVDAAVITELPSNPNTQNQIGNINAVNKNKEIGLNSNVEPTTSTSGQVIDETGKPVSGIKLAIRPVKKNEFGRWVPSEIDEFEEQIDMSLDPVETDTQGRFRINNMIRGPVLLSLFPFNNPKPDVEMLTVETNGLSFYPSDFGVPAIVFSTTPGEEIENIKVTLRLHPRIRGKVNRMDGTPLANKTIDLHIQTWGLDENTRIELPGTTTTDDNGEFEEYLDGEHFISNMDAKLLMFSTVSVVYERWSAKSKPIQIRSNAETHELVFNMSLSPQTPTSLDSSFLLDAIDVWVMNPENGHIYKKIGCSNPLAAVDQAKKEGANLVTINDAAEQNWLNRVFGASDTFIGLNDIAEEGQWQWQSGEPVEYTNWVKGVTQDKKSKHEDYVILSKGKWKDIGPRNSQWYNIRTVIIEKKVEQVKQ